MANVLLRVGGLFRGFDCGLGGIGHGLSAICGLYTGGPSRGTSFSSHPVDKKDPPPFPPPPKKPLSSFMLFARDQRAEMSKTHPGLKPTEIMSEIGRRWRSLDSKKKEMYVESFKQEVNQYSIAHQAYMSSLSIEQKYQLRQQELNKLKELRKRRFHVKLRQLQKPVGARNQFAFFVASRMPDRGNLKITEYMKTLGEKWKALPEKEKEVFKQQAESDKKRYAKEMATWTSRMEKEGQAEALEAAARHLPSAVSRSIKIPSSLVSSHSKTQTSKTSRRGRHRSAEE